MSPALPAYTMSAPPRPADAYSISKRPGVSNRAAPPAAGTLYKCSQPSFSAGNTRVSPLHMSCASELSA